MSYEALEALRREARENAEALAALDATLKPFFMAEVELVHVIVRTYPYRIGENKFGGPVPFVTGYAPATEERMDLRVQLDAIRWESAPQRRERAERHRLRGWLADRIADLLEAQEGGQKSKKTRQPERKMRHDLQPKLL
jgi:hypothetical protein